MPLCDEDIYAFCRALSENKPEDATRLLMSDMTVNVFIDRRFLLDVVMAQGRMENRSAIIELVFQCDYLNPQALHNVRHPVVRERLAKLKSGSAHSSRIHGGANRDVYVNVKAIGNSDRLNLAKLDPSNCIIEYGDIMSIIGELSDTSIAPVNEDINETLMNLCRKGTTERSRVSMQQTNKASVEFVKDGKNILHSFAGCHSPEVSILKLLLDNALPGTIDRPVRGTNETALMLAVRTDNELFTQCLLDSKANIALQNSEGQTVFDMIKKFSNMKTLLYKYKFQAMSVDELREYLLRLFKSKDMEAVRVLYENCQDYVSEQSILDDAIAFGDIRVLEYVIKDLKVSMKDKDLLKILFSAPTKEILSFLLRQLPRFDINSQSSDGTTLLMHVVQTFRSKDMVEELFQLFPKLDVNIYNNALYTALMQCSSDDIRKFLKKRNAKGIECTPLAKIVNKSLVDFNDSFFNFEAHIRNELPITDSHIPCFYNACKLGKDRFVEYFIMRSANFDARKVDVEGNSALMYAITKCSAKTIQSLLELKFDQCHFNKKFSCVLFECIRSDRSDIRALFPEVISRANHLITPEHLLMVTMSCLPSENTEYYFYVICAMYVAYNGALNDGFSNSLLTKMIEYPRYINYVLQQRIVFEKGQTLLHHITAHNQHVQLPDCAEIHPDLVTLGLTDTTETDGRLGDTALHLAVRNCNLRAVEALMFYNANPQAQNASKETPLGIAIAMRSSTDENSMRLRMCMYNAQIKAGQTTELVKIIQSNGKKFLNEMQLIFHCYTVTQVPIPVSLQFILVKMNWKDALVMAVDQFQANPHVLDVEESSLLHHAAGAGVSCVEFLLAKGCDPRWGNRNGETSLGIAVLSGRLAAIELMNDYIAKNTGKVNIPLVVDNRKTTNTPITVPNALPAIAPTSNTIKNTPNHAPPAQVVPTNLPRRDNTVTTASAKDKLFPTKCKSYCLTSTPQLSEIEAMLKKDGVNPNVEDEDGCSALYHSCRFNKPDLTGLLAKYGAVIDPTTPKHPVIIAATTSSKNSMEVLLKTKLWTIDDICMQKYQQTVLLLAAEKSTLEFVTFLVKSKADTTRTDVDGQNALEISLENEKFDIAKYLDAAQNF